MRLTFDADVEAFRAEFAAFLDEHPPDDAAAVQRSRSSSDLPPEFGGRDAVVRQQYVHADELALRLLGSEAVQSAIEYVLSAMGADGLIHPFRRDHRRRHVGNSAEHHRSANPRSAKQLELRDARRTSLGA